MKSLFLLLCVFALSMTQAFSNSNNAAVLGYITSGCTCHSGSSSNTTASITGSSNFTFAPGATATLTFTTTNANRPRAGVALELINSSNTRVTGLNTVSGAGLAASNNALYHAGAKTISNNTASWQFSFTAPSTPGQYTLRYATNATTSSSSGDWALGTQTVIVKGLTLTAPTSAVAICAGNSVSVQWTSFGVSNVNIELSSNSGGQWTQVATATSNNGNNSTTFNLPGTTPAGNTYRVRVVDQSDATINSASTDLTVGSPVQITTQPTPTTQTVCAGANVSFAVAGTGSGIQYQWRKDGTPVNGANQATYTMNNITTAQAGTYDCVVSGTCGTPVTSQQCSVSVNPATQITTQPQSQTVCAGANVTFSVTAGGGGLSYRWRYNGTDISGATQATYTKNSVIANDTGNYSCVVTGQCGAPITSNNARLTVGEPAQFTQHPESQEKCENASVTFSARVLNSNGITFEWAKDGSLVSDNSRISGATTTTLTINSLTLADIGSYTMRAITTVCSSVIISNAGGLTVNPAPKVTTQPQSKTIGEGASTTFSVVASGNDVRYQWKKGATDISGATLNTFTISNAKKADEGKYTVVVSNSCGTATSQEATLTVSNAPIPVLTLSAANIEFGKLRTGVASAERTIKVSNTGTAQLTITAIELTGAAAQGIDLDKTVFTLNAGANKDIVVKFTPTASGVRTAGIEFKSNAGDPQTIAVTGEGVARGIDPRNSFDFPNDVEAGKSDEQTITVNNATATALGISAITVTSPEFSVTAPSVPAQLDIAGKQDIKVRFAPTSEGPKNGFLIIKYATTGADQFDSIAVSAVATKQLSVSDGAEAGIALYPHPVSSDVFLNVPESLAIGSTLRMIDALGATVLTLDVQSQRTPLNVSGIASGSYRVLISNGARNFVLPLVVLR
ncbi:MAG: immunoglobulin domain-containing protein [Candidatus Kapabacteria bacterium]|nr:immunoglobulin domain-containing protein [Candidatus Kapabacteria bacterium]